MLSHTDSVNSTERFHNVLRQFWMDAQFELQLINFHLRVFHIETILYHLPRVKERG